MKHFYFTTFFLLGIYFLTNAQDYSSETDTHCTYTQAFYGNYDGKACGDIPVADFIYGLLYEDLVIGSGNNTLTITKDDVDCLIGRLPGHGPSVPLDGQATCERPKGIELWYGYFKNSLLNQTITLGLNLRADVTLGQLILNDRKLKTWKAKDCANSSAGKKGGSQSYYLSQSVLDYLGENNSVADLYALANDALAGEESGKLELWQISGAVSVINYAFNNTRILKGFYSRQKETKVDFGDQDMFAMRVFPNPMVTHGTIEFTTMEAAVTTIEIYNVMGERLDIFMNEFTEEFTPVIVNFNTYKYSKGMFILYIRNGSNVYKEKITIVH